MQTKKVGVIAILCASILWAIEPIFAKLSYETADFMQTFGIRAIFASLIALVYMLFSKKLSFSLKPREIPPVLYIAVMGTLVADLLYLFSLTMIPVLNAVLIGHLQPIFIVIMAWVVLRQDKLNRFDYAGIVIMIVAAIFVTSGTVDRLLSLQLGSYGDVIVLVATVTWASAAIVMRKYIRGIHTGLLTFYRFFIASLVSSLLLFLNHNFFIDNIFQIVLGLMIGVGTILYYEGLKRIKAAQVGALELSTPLFATILGFVILSEGVTNIQILGIIMVCIGIYFLSKKED